jgi:hypothetical protein
VAIGDGRLYLRLAGRNRIDEIGIEQERRMLEHPGCHFRLVAGEAENDCRRCVLAEGKRPRQLGAHQRRGIVEQHDERALGGRPIIRAKLGIKKGAGQRAGRITSLRGGRRAHPLQELTNDHGATGATTS